MKITKRQLRRIIKEMTISADEAEVYLRDRAATYARDGLQGRGMKMLLQDDFLDDLGHQHNIEDYEWLIDELVGDGPMGDLPGIGESKIKITKRQLRSIIREMHPRAMADDAYVADLESQEDELATQIRHASKDIHGRKDVYDLEGKSIEELEDILYDLSNSQEQRALDNMYRDEEEDLMGRDQDLSRAEASPLRQGMGRRPSGSKSQRRMETKRFIKKLISEQFDPAVEANKLLDQTMTFLENKLYGKYSDEEVDSFAVEAMNRMGSIEELIIKLMDGGYREDY